MGEPRVIEYLYVQFSDKRNYRIPAMLIARCRAQHYAALDTIKHPPDFQETFETEVKFVLGDSFELQDWAENNMDWSDLRHVAELMEGSSIDLEREWVNAYKWVEYEQPKQTDADKAMEELFDA